MIFKLKSFEDGFMQEAYDEGMKKLNDFWGINWVRNTPDIYVVESREDINKIKGMEIEDWVVGWAAGSDTERKRIFLLEFDKLETESDHKKDEKKYKALIAHELCHLFVGIVSRRTPLAGPMWWNEGLSVYLSGQINFRKRPNKFVGFLNSNRENPVPAYNEGGFVVELLVNKYGKEKIIELVKSLGDYKNEGDFDKFFERVYGFELSYEKINEIYFK